MKVQKVVVKKTSILQEDSMAGMLTSRVTEGSRTTLPAGVREALGIRPGERLGYIIHGNEVKLVNASTFENEDPVVSHFLAFIARDMIDHPDRVKPFPRALMKRAKELVGDMAIDHDAEIEGVTAL